MLDHVLCDSGLRDFNSELEQFPMQPWCSPQDIGTSHVVNQIPDFSRNPGATNPSRTAFAFPVESKSLSMPGDHRIGLDEQEAVTPLGPEPGEKDPQNPIGCPKPEPFLVGSLQDDELVAQSHDFELQGGSGSQAGHKPDEDRQQHVVHG